MMEKRYIVWNAARSEAVLFDERRDALSACDGKSRRGSISSLAMHFFESYGEEDKLTVEEVFL